MTTLRSEFALLHQQTFSLEHAAFGDLLAQTQNLLIVQDLDGCGRLRLQTTAVQPLHVAWRSHSSHYVVVQKTEISESKNHSVIQFPLQTHELSCGRLIRM